jgi:hypothetical protein
MNQDFLILKLENEKLKTLVNEITREIKIFKKEITEKNSKIISELNQKIYDLEIDNHFYKTSLSIFLELTDKVKK